MEDDEMLTCSDCSCEVSVDDAVHDSHLPDTTYCVDCYRVCERCDDIASTDAIWHVVDGSEIWCESCTDYRASWCDYCEEYTSGSNYFVSDRDGGYCENCIGNANFCDNCDEYNMDGCSCDENNVVHDYSYRPDPIFHSTNPDDKLFFGIEIEVENAKQQGWQHRVQAAEYAQSRLEDIDLAYLKNDGSLSDGFEIVTHPMTHDFYMNNASVLWDTLEHLRSSMKMRSWNAGTCGLHIHISRAGFKGAAHMHRFLNLVYSNEEFYSLMAGRSSSRWAKFDDVKQSEFLGRDEDGNRSYKIWNSYRDKIQRGRNTDRYSAVNTQNAHTLEMRIFRGSINSSTVRAAISLAHASVEFTRNLAVPHVASGALNSETLMQYIDDNASLYPDLVARLDMLAPERNQVTI